jgi:hypothetical protein
MVVGERTVPLIRAPVLVRVRVKYGLELGPPFLIGVIGRFLFGLGVTSYEYRAILEARAVEDGLSVGSCFITLVSLLHSTPDMESGTDHSIQEPHLTDIFNCPDFKLLILVIQARNGSVHAKVAFHTI